MGPQGSPCRKVDDVPHHCPPGLGCACHTRVTSIARLPRCYCAIQCKLQSVAVLASDLSAHLLERRRAVLEGSWPQSKAYICPCERIHLVADFCLNQLYLLVCRKDAQRKLNAKERYWRKHGDSEAEFVYDMR
jgi:hypothetical protein